MDINTDSLDTEETAANKRRNRSGSNELITDENAQIKRSRSTSASRAKNDFSEVLNAIRRSEERIIDQMKSMLDLKIAEIRTEFDDKLAKLSSSFDHRIQVANSHSEMQSADGQQLKDVVAKLDTVSIVNGLRVDFLERVHSLQDVIITGIPFRDGEDVYSHFKIISETINFPQALNAISSVFRVVNKAEKVNSSSSSSAYKIVNYVSPVIIAKFVSIDFSRQFISHYLKFKQLNLMHLGFETPTRIYVNENLTKITRELFRYCVKMKQLHRSTITNVFTRNGIIYAKFAGIDKHLLITSKMELDKYISSFPATQPSAV